jgi:hypothetical protein
MKIIKTKQFKEAQNFFEKTKRLNRAITFGDHVEVQKLLDQGYSPDQTSISVAMGTGDQELVRLVQQAYRTMIGVRPGTNRPIKNRNW